MGLCSRSNAPFIVPGKHIPNLCIHRHDHNPWTRRPRPYMAMPPIVGAGLPRPTGEIDHTAYVIANTDRATILALFVRSAKTREETEDYISRSFIFLCGFCKDGDRALYA